MWRCVINDPYVSQERNPRSEIWNDRMNSIHSAEGGGTFDFGMRYDYDTDIS